MIPEERFINSQVPIFPINHNLTNNCDKLHLAIILSIALIIGIYLITTTTLIAKDGVSYIHYAKALSSSPLEVIQDCSDYAPRSYTPGYPFLILMTHRLVDLLGDFPPVLSWVYSAQAIALFCRILALIPLYFIGKELVGNKMSFWAILILVILPYPAKLGSDALRDWPYMLFLATGFLFLYWAVRYRKWMMFGFVGVIAGLGYLIRPVCVQLLAYGALWLIFNIFNRQHKYRLSRTKLMGGLALLVIGFAVVAAPYMKVKGEIFPTRIQQIMGSFSYGYDSNEISEQNGNIYQAKIVPVDTAKALWKISDGINTNLMYYFMPFLFVGIYHYFRKKPKNELFFLIKAFILFNIVILIVRYYISPEMSRRYILPLIAFTIFFVPVGLQVLGGEIDKLLCKHGNSERGRQQWFFILLIIGIAVCLPKLLRPLRIEKMEYRLAAEWLNKNTPENSLLAISGIDPRVIFYAGRKSVQTMSHNADYAVKMYKNRTMPICEDGVFVFNGKNDFIDSGASPIPSSGDFSISAWVYCEGKSQNNSDNFGTALGSASWTTTNAVKGIALRTQNTANDLCAVIGDGLTHNRLILLKDITTVNKQKWYHIVLVYVSADNILRGYVNKEYIGSCSKVYADSGQSFCIGHSGKLNSSEAFWYGKVKNVEIFDNALSSSEIAELYLKENIPVDCSIKYSLNLGKSQVVVYPLPLISLSKELANK